MLAIYIHFLKMWTNHIKTFFKYELEKEKKYQICLTSGITWSKCHSNTHEKCLTSLIFKLTGYSYSKGVSEQEFTTVGHRV